MSDKEFIGAFPKADSVRQRGMSLRDYFAAKAMASLTSVYWEAFESYESGADLNKCLCETAYEMADAMLEAREK